MDSALETQSKPYYGQAKVHDNYRFSVAGLLRNILSEALVMYHTQRQTQKQVKQKEQNFQIDFAKIGHLQPA